MNGERIMNKRQTNTIVLEGVEIYDGWEQDGRTFGYNTQKQIVGAAYGVTGAAIGAAVGALFFGVGSVPGAIIGGFIGALVGGWAGETLGEAAYDELTKLSQ